MIIKPNQPYLPWWDKHGISQGLMKSQDSVKACDNVNWIPQPRVLAMLLDQLHPLYSHSICFFYDIHDRLRICSMLTIEYMYLIPGHPPYIYLSGTAVSVERRHVCWLLRRSF